VSLAGQGAVGIAAPRAVGGIEAVQRGGNSSNTVAGAAASAVAGIGAAVAELDLEEGPEAGGSNR